MIRHMIHVKGYWEVSSAIQRLEEKLAPVQRPFKISQAGTKTSPHALKPLGVSLEIEVTPQSGESQQEVDTIARLYL